jgi:hypothetical protein
MFKAHVAKMFRPEEAQPAKPEPVGFANVLKGAPFGNDNAAGPHNMSGGKGGGKGGGGSGGKGNGGLTPNLKEGISSAVDSLLESGDMFDAFDGDDGALVDSLINDQLKDRDWLANRGVSSSDAAMIAAADKQHLHSFVTAEVAKARSTYLA